MRRRDIIAYVIAQVLGAVLGVFALRAQWGARAQSVHFGATLLGREVTVVEGFLAETGITFLSAPLP